MSSQPPTDPTAILAHSLMDDIQAFGSAMVLIALGLHLLSSGQVVVGGVPGLAFLLQHISGWSLGLCLLVVNLPFYALAWSTLGMRFTGKTLLAMSLLAVTVESVRASLSIAHIAPWLAAVAGGMTVGVGLLILLRHQASLGGVGVLALYLQRRHGWHMGAVQLVLDGLILLAGALVLGTDRLPLSILAALALNLVLLWNHRPGRYLGG